MTCDREIASDNHGGGQSRRIGARRVIGAYLAPAIERLPKLENVVPENRPPRSVRRQGGRRGGQQRTTARDCGDRPRRRCGLGRAVPTHPRASAAC